MQKNDLLTKHDDGDYNNKNDINYNNNEHPNDIIKIPINKIQRQNSGNFGWSGTEGKSIQKTWRKASNQTDYETLPKRRNH